MPFLPCHMFRLAVHSVLLDANSAPLCSCKHTHVTIVLSRLYSLFNSRHSWSRTSMGLSPLTWPTPCLRSAPLLRRAAGPSRLKSVSLYYFNVQYFVEWDGIVLSFFATSCVIDLLRSHYCWIRKLRVLFQLCSRNMHPIHNIIDHRASSYRNKRWTYTA